MSNRYVKSIENYGIYFLIFSRLNSTRLKGKAKLKIGKYSIIEIIILRLLKKIPKNKIIICTSKNKNDNFYYKLAKKYNINIFFGSEKNYVLRIKKCIEKFKIKYFFRINGDNPLIDYDIFKYYISNLEKNKKYEYIYCNNILRGTRTELIKSNTIFTLFKIIKNKYSSEYLTFYYFRNDLFLKKFFKLSDTYMYEKNYTVALDDLDNFNLIKKIIIDNNIYISRKKIFRYLKDYKYLKKQMVNSKSKIPLLTSYYDARIIGDNSNSYIISKY